MSGVVGARLPRGGGDPEAVCGLNAGSIVQVEGMKHLDHRSQEGSLF